jgi:hypothetical protein
VRSQLQECEPRHKQLLGNSDGIGRSSDSREVNMQGPTRIAVTAVSLFGVMAFAQAAPCLRLVGLAIIAVSCPSANEGAQP